MNVKKYTPKQETDPKDQLVDICIIHNKSVEVIKESKEEWGCRETHTDHFVEGFSVAGKDKYHDLSVGFVPEYGKEYYLLYVVYSTGDSFNSNDDGGIEFIDLYEDQKIGEDNLERIRKHHEEQDSKSLFLINEQGNKHKVHTPWTGYFERFSYVCLDSVRLNGGRKIWRP